MKFQKKTYNYVEYGNLEKAICDYLKIKEYNIPCQEELMNGVLAKYNITNAPDEELSSIFVDGVVQMYRTPVIMEHMCKDGLIEPGEWLVDISW